MRETVSAEKLTALLLEIQQWETVRAWCDVDDLNNAEERLDEAKIELAALLCGDAEGNLPEIPAFTPQEQP